MVTFLVLFADIKAFDCWTEAYDDVLVVGSNVRYIPSILLGMEGVCDQVAPREDSFWGPHEYSRLPQRFCPDSPYMAWCPIGYMGDHLPSHISSFRLDDLSSNPDHYFIPNRSWPSRGRFNMEIFETFQSDLNNIFYQVKQEMDAIRSDETLSHIRQPLRAVERAYSSALGLRVNFSTLYDIKQYLACLQRSVAELQGFLLWRRDEYAWASDTITLGSNPNHCRGAVATTGSEYRFL